MGIVGWRTVAFIASVTAAGVHFGAAREHLLEYAPAGLFMLVSGAAQLTWGIWAGRGAPRRVLEAGIAGNAAIIALFVATRTAGMPAGPEAGMPEHLHGPDVLATIAEVVAVLAGIALASTPGLRLEPVLVRATLACAAGALVVGGDDPTHERLVAAATLALALGVRALLAASPQLVRSERRSHVKDSLVRRVARPRLVAARAHGGARG